jgi:UbiD family decarboxylase
MPFADLRAFLQRLEKAGQLQRVDTALRCGRGDNELQALMRYLHDQNNIALILENLEGYNTPGVPIIFNPYGSRERTAMIMGTHDLLGASGKTGNATAMELLKKGGFGVSWIPWEVHTARNGRSSDTKFGVNALCTNEIRSGT